MVRLILHCKKGEEKAIGERFCEELKGDEALKNRDIVINYNHAGKIIIWLGKDWRSIFQVDASEIICGNLIKVN